MAWTEPKTWTSEPLVASDLNTHLRDNLNELKDPPSAHYELDELVDYTTNSTSFVNVDGAKLALTIVTNGGDVLVNFHGLVATQSAGSPYCYFDIEVDTTGNRVGGNDGICMVKHNPSYPALVAFTRLITGLAAGSHTFRLQWKVSASTETLYAGAGTSSYDIHPQFWVREVS